MNKPDLKKGLKHGCLILVLFFAGVLPTWAAAPQSPEEAQQQIQKIQTEMKKLRSWLDEVKSEKTSIEASLEDQEKAIQKLLEQIKTLQENIAKGEKQLSDLQRQQQQLQLSIQQQNEQIAAQLRAVYRSGQQESIKYLLNGSDPSESMRLVYYNRYFSNARQSLVNAFANEVNELHLVEKSIRNQRAQQSRDQLILSNEKKSLEVQQLNRKNLLVKLNNDILKGSQRSEKLLKDEAQLKELLKRLEAALADINLLAEDADFAELKGKLSRPLPRINVIEDTGQVNFGGVSLAANANDSVRAIYHGRVIFSEWLRGFGFLMILDHGGGYMSLYGYNQSLLREVGEWVNVNDVIATAGSSGGRSETSLFFAIRSNGTPLDPLEWIQR